MTGNWQFATVTNGRLRYSFSALKNMWADRTMCLRPNTRSKRVIRLLLRFSARQLSFADASVVILSRFICLDKRQSKYKAGIRFQSGIATTFLNVSPTPIVFTNHYFCISISILITVYTTQSPTYRDGTGFAPPCCNQLPHLLHLPSSPCTTGKSEKQK